MNIIFKHTGDLSATRKFLTTKKNFNSILSRYGQMGVVALAESTPKDSGMTANSWDYEIKSSTGSYTISWSNSNVSEGIPIAILIQYGHGTGNGGYVEARDFINPAMKPIFDKLADDLWKEVTSL